MSGPVLYEVLEQVAYITLNRPDKLNAMDDDLLAGVAQALAQASSDTQAKVVVMRGAGRVFCAGGMCMTCPSNEPKQITGPPACP